jgi:hypothetical protein
MYPFTHCTSRVTPVLAANPVLVKLKRARIFVPVAGGGFKVIAKNAACTSINNEIIKTQ